MAKKYIIAVDLTKKQADILLNAIDCRIDDVEENLKVADIKANKLAYKQEKKELEKLWHIIDKSEPLFNL